MSEDLLTKMEELYKIEDFSEPITDVEGTQMGIFWDLGDCPFPGSMNDPDLIYQKIESELIGRGFRGEMSIWVYVDDSSSWGGEMLSKKTWKSRIFFLPVGFKPAQRMFNDIYLWVIDSPVDFPDRDLIVVSSEVRRGSFFKHLSVLESGRRYRVFLVDPTDCVSSSENSQWPAFLFHQMYSFAKKDKVSEEGPPHKRRTLAPGTSGGQG